ncbi:MAG TPA: cyclic nucleotide-binding domain-containing protein [Syntrophobacteraceae bacterium]|nr:cyclic nucleotide-binding domain-containing protein [Syntrophobacteraceae bacterium]
MAENENKGNRLKESTIFRGLPQEKLDEVARAVQNVVVPGNSLIFREGDPGDSFYIISSGRVRVFRRLGGDMETELSVLGPGDSFGEMALLTGEPRSADIETLEETHLMVLTKDQFDHILRDCPDISRTFVKEMRRWLLRDQELLEVEAREAYKATRLSWVDFLVVFAVSIVLALIFNSSNPNGIPLFPKFPDRASFPSVSPVEAMEAVQRGDALLVDAMPSNFFAKRHIQGAVNMPLALFDIVYMMSFAEEDKEKKIIVYGGTVSKLYDLEVANKLLLRGYSNVRILEGGLSAWEQNGYPVVEKAKK